jgi:exopolysaccharide production protein ExoQ
MSSIVDTANFETVPSELASKSSSAALLRWRRVMVAVGFVGLVFFVSDHTWLISRFEDYSGSSEFMETVTSEGNTSRQVAIFALGFVSALILIRKNGYPLRMSSVLAVLTAAAASWCAASWFWSIDPAIAARRLVFAGCIALAALAAARSLKPRELAAAAMLCSAGYLAIGVLTEIALGTFHPGSFYHRFAGTVHPNFQGLNCSLLGIAASYLATNSSHHRRTLWALAGVGLIALWLTKSRTPLAALVVAEASLWFTTVSWQKKLVAAGAAIFVACGLVLIAGDSLMDRVAQSALLGRGEDEEVGALTGRVPLWEELSESIGQRPWQGYGFSSFWVPKNIEDISDSQQWAISVAHSAYLDLTLGIGLVGAGLSVAVVLLGLIRAFRLDRAMPGMGFGFVAMLLIFILVHGLTESAFANPGFVPLVALSGLAMLAFVDPAQYQEAQFSKALQCT